MLKGLIRYTLFLLAYIPIYIVGALKNIDPTLVDKAGKKLTITQVLSNNHIPLAFLCLTIVLIIYFKIYSRLALKPKGNPIFTIKKISPQHKEYITYLGTYILPFVGMKTTNFFDIIAVVFMFLTIGFIFSKTNLIYTNPTLAFFGYEIFEIEDENGNKIDCITKDTLKEGDKPKGIKLGNKTFILSQWKNNN